MTVGAGEEGPGEASLVERDGKIVLRTSSGFEDLSGLEVFRAAIRGEDVIRDFRLAKSPMVSAPEITFHPQPAAVALLLKVEAGSAVAMPVIRHRAEWVRLHLESGLDHQVVENNWYPVDPDTRGSVLEWLRGSSSTGAVSTESYFDLYTHGNRQFELIDELPDEAVAALPGALPDRPELTSALYPYQSAGLEWLSARAAAGLGGILADEMGLGKTLQLIALILQRLAATKQPILVIVPLTLVENWVREFAKFAPGTFVYRHTGPKRSRRPSEIAKQPIVITTYETAVIDEGLLGMIDWDAVIADEAQAIKNPDAQRTKSVGAFRRNAAFAVTGTPLENRTQDVWSLASFALPGYLGTRAEFASRLETEPQELRRAIRPLMLRREVQDVAQDLPEKIAIDSPLEMFAPEAEAYEQVISGVRNELRKIPVLALITKLRLFTAHPDSVNGRGPSPETRSAKLTRLLEILDEIVSADQKVLVFVAFNVPAEIVRDAIRRRFGIAVWGLDGGTPVRDRLSIVDQFSVGSGSAALVLNPAAGGVGLNIQAARHVIHYTLEWNPAREAQATARAWRRGQEHPVTVHRLYYANSIDELILEKLVFKQELFDEVVQPTEETGASLRELLDRALERSYAPY